MNEAGFAGSWPVRMDWGELRIQELEGAPAVIWVLRGGMKGCILKEKTLALPEKQPEPGCGCTSSCGPALGPQSVSAMSWLSPPAQKQS